MFSNGWYTESRRCFGTKVQPPSKAGKAFLF